MPKMTRRFVANDPRLLTGIGIREQNRIRVDGSRTGTMLYGPYIPLFPGDYEATVKFDPAITPKGSAMLDVAVDTGRRVLATRTINSEQLMNQGMSASLGFSCNDLMRRAEIRLSCSSEFVAAIQSVEICGEFTPTGAGEGFMASDLPPVNVRNEISRGRNLYEGYQRGLALAIPTVAEKLRIDLDFQEALQLSGGRTIVIENNLANIFMLIKLYIPSLPFSHIVEFGSFKGGSAIFMASLAQKFLPNVQVLAFDTFAGMPATDKAVDLHNAGDFQGVDLPELRQYVADIGLKNLHFIQGRFEDSAPPAARGLQRIALCHIDCDIRSAIQSAYDTTRPYMVPGAYWVFDDPLQPTCLGAMEAVEDLLIRRDSLNAEQVWPHPVFRKPLDKQESS
jgi:Macrocin-O-methyltransferase (TylF)